MPRPSTRPLHADANTMRAPSPVIPTSMQQRQQRQRCEAHPRPRPPSYPQHNRMMVRPPPLRSDNDNGMTMQRRSRIVLTHLVHTSTRDHAASLSPSSCPHPLLRPSPHTGKMTMVSRLAAPDSNNGALVSPSPRRPSTHGDDSASPRPSTRRQYCTLVSPSLHPLSLHAQRRRRLAPAYGKCHTDTHFLDSPSPRQFAHTRTRVHWPPRLLDNGALVSPSPTS